jgi:hypothetical protein
VYQGSFPLKKIKDCVAFYDLIKLALFQFPGLPLKQSFTMVWGSAKSQGLTVLYL